MPFPEYLQKAITQSQEYCSRLVATAPLAVELDAVTSTKEFQKLKPALDTTYTTDYNNKSYGVRITLTAAFPRKAAYQALKLLSDGGFTRHPNYKEPTKNEAYGYTDWTLTKDVILRVISDGEHCRKVQVGTKTVPEHEEPVYETLCGDALKDFLAKQKQPVEATK